METWTASLSPTTKVPGLSTGVVELFPTCPYVLSPPQQVTLPSLNTKHVLPKPASTSMGRVLQEAVWSLQNSLAEQSEESEAHVKQAPFAQVCPAPTQDLLPVCVGQPLAFGAQVIVPLPAVLQNVPEATHPSGGGGHFLQSVAPGRQPFGQVA